MDTGQKQEKVRLGWVDGEHSQGCPAASGPLAGGRAETQGPVCIRTPGWASGPASAPLA